MYIQNEIVNDPILELGVEQDLLMAGLVDSIKLMQIVAHVEETAGVKVPAEDITITNFQNVKAIAAYVVTLKSK